MNLLKLEKMKSEKTKNILGKVILGLLFLIPVSAFGQDVAVVEAVQAADSKIGHLAYRKRCMVGDEGIPHSMVAKLKECKRSIGVL